MTLMGALEDRINVRKFLDTFGFTPGVMVKPLDNALREDIEDLIGKVIKSCPPLLIAYFQGHGEQFRQTVRYITGDRKVDSMLEGICAEEFVGMFSKLTAHTLALVITDFCHSGNVLRLQFQLFIAPNGCGFWVETDEWIEDQRVGKKDRVVSPMLHVAASLRQEQAYETAKRGGYTTNGLAHLEPDSTTLTGFLVDLRQNVVGHLVDAKAHTTQPLHRSATQVPQIFCSGQPPANDPEIFAMIRTGTVHPF
ncbi:unnamed protein product [Rhizoctonia solani]|uniref:Peptidase C14 caspase domain-containing protein n=1 Tax=Rhizoctonia solani TaxID=456999 RepID=A0A8H3BT05_9AGAM|nr:unnamed protein product [Rhizoctonia solani]